MRVSAVLPALLATGVLAGYEPSPTVAKRDVPSPFVSAQDGLFVVNGSNFRFIGTNAYWLPFLPDEDDISAVLANMSAAGITVVRTWAFNDVTSIPTDGSPWLQLIANGTATINNGTDGMQKLDRFVELAQEQGIYVLWSLTNNWNPLASEAVLTGLSRRDEPSPDSSRPRNFLSNDYGGMDAYVREFSESGMHSEFYTNMTIRAIFQNYTEAVVSRFVDNPWVLSWELANDPRCNSTLPTADDCTTHTVTSWHADVGDFVRSIDPNHLVSSGAHGFTCATCTKLFPLAPPKPAPSSTPKSKRKFKRGAVSALTAQMRRVSEARKSKRDEGSAAGMKIRGRWMANGDNVKRQSSSSTLGIAFDGSTGVDSTDILNAPSIGFGSLMYFPDQTSYSTLGQSTAPSSSSGLGQETIGPNALNFSTILQQGVDWIQMQAQLAQEIGKPLALTGFGLINQENAPFYTPFNATTPLLAGLATATVTSGADLVRRQAVGQGTPPTTNVTLGVTQEQQDTAYSTWLQAGISAGLGGLIQWQWSAGNLSAIDGSLVQSNFTGASNSTAGTLNQGDSPNDGYGGLGQQINVQGILGQAVLNLTQALNA